MTQQTIGRLNQQASVRRFQMDDVTFTFVADGAMSMAPQMLLKAIPPAYWDAHPDHLDRNGRVAMSTGALLVERDHHHLLIDAGPHRVNPLRSDRFWCDLKDVVHHTDRGSPSTPRSGLPNASPRRAFSHRSEPSAADNALAETINGLYKTELIKPRKPWRTVEEVELATAEWVHR
jgi:transposase InsO family protein